MQALTNTTFAGDWFESWALTWHQCCDWKTVVVCRCKIVPTKIEGRFLRFPFSILWTSRVSQLLEQAALLSPAGPNSISCAGGAAWIGDSGGGDCHLWINLWLALQLKYKVTLAHPPSTPFHIKSQRTGLSPRFNECLNISAVQSKGPWK